MLGKNNEDGGVEGGRKLGWITTNCGVSGNKERRGQSVEAVKRARTTAKRQRQQRTKKTKTIDKNIDEGV